MALHSLTSQAERSWLGRGCQLGIESACHAFALVPGLDDNALRRHARGAHRGLSVVFGNRAAGSWALWAVRLAAGLGAMPVAQP